MNMFVVLVMTPYKTGGTEYVTYGPFYKHEDAAAYAAEYGNTDDVQVVEVWSPEEED